MYNNTCHQFNRALPLRGVGPTCHTLPRRTFPPSLDQYSLGTCRSYTYTPCSCVQRVCGCGLVGKSTNVDLLLFSVYTFLGYVLFSVLSSRLVGSVSLPVLGPVLLQGFLRGQVSERPRLGRVPVVARVDTLVCNVSFLSTRCFRCEMVTCTRLESLFEIML